jgi:hypothetical protein
MCVLGLGATLGLGGGAAAATGAAAAANTLSTIGTIVSIGGSLLGGMQEARAYRAQEAAIAQQAATEAQLNAIQDNRERREFLSALAQQRAELAARGVQLDSVTAVSLGETAAREMAFQGQATRQSGMARQTELSAAAQAARFKRQGSMLRGIFSAADSFLTAAPDIWPSLKGA